MDIFSAMFEGFTIWNVIAVIVGGLSIPLLYYFLFVRRKRRKAKGKAKGAPREYDLRVFVVDDNSMRIREIFLNRISGIVYGAVNVDEPLYFVHLPNTRFYDYYGEKVLLGKQYGMLIVPMDAEVETTIKLMESAEENEIVELTREDVISFIDKVLNIQQKKKGTVVVPGVAKITFSFDPSRLGSNILERTLHSGVITIRRFFSGMQEFDKFIDYIRAKTEYERVKISKWTAIGIGIAIVIIALTVLFAFFAAGGGK